MNPPEPLKNPNQSMAIASLEKNGIEEGQKLARLTQDNVNRAGQQLALLLDLSGNEQAAREWAAAVAPRANVQPISKADLKWSSKREALAQVRSLGPDIFCVFTSDLRMQSGRASLMLFAILAGSGLVVVGDSIGRLISRSRFGVLWFEAPRFVLELLFGYGLIVPLSWLLTEMLMLSHALRGVVRASRTGGRVCDPDRTGLFNVLYLRATLAGALEGGMLTHVAGFASGAGGLGHTLRFLVSAQDNAVQDNRDDSLVIRPSPVFSATRALFEVWNNIVFGIRSLLLISHDSLKTSDFDFIYQRYSRFNWTGVLLAAVTGLPLVLEFNGSEVWVSRQWDPVGLQWLLKRFERLNQLAADLIFVVSDVERRNSLNAGVHPEKLIVNPNGVDPARFHPDCGGRALRRSIGIDEETIVIGFVGTFGPWHGAPVLAEAATRIESTTRFCFLFVGDGEERSRTEKIIEAAGKKVVAVFTGRISHSDVPAHLDACDILVAPTLPADDGSEFFGSPTKLFEYMAMARPVVGSRLGQIAEVIDEGINGLLVEPGDINALARAINKLAIDHQLRERLGAAARKKVIERYTWRHNAARVFEGVQQAL